MAPIIATAALPGSIDQDDTLVLTQPPAQTCPPWCALHRDGTTHPGDLSPGTAHHRGLARLVPGGDGSQSAYIEVRAEQWDSTRPGVSEPAHGSLFASADDIALTPAGLYQLAAAALSVAAQIDPGHNPLAEVGRAALDAAFRLGRASDPALPADEARLSAQIDAGPLADPWFALRQLLTGQTVPASVLDALRGVGGAQ